MGAYFIDLDGTFFLYGTNKLTPRGAEIAKAINERGGKIYFITARKKNNNPEHLGLAQTHLALKELGIQYELIIGDIPSPRILINDEGATAYNVEINSGFTPQISLDVMAHSVYSALAGLTWVNSKFGKPGGSDDYVQTILISESLILNSGFNHLDIVSKLRAIPPIVMNNQNLSPGGMAMKRYKGQLSKLIDSNDPCYMAKDGVSDGAGMRTLGIGAYFVNDFKGLVYAASEIAAITHGSIEARLSAVLTALRYRQIFSNDITASPFSLYHQLVRASRMLDLGDKAEFFLNRVNTAAAIVTKFHHPAIQLFQLSKFIGIDHLCWSTPIAATFWSFHCDDNYNKWFKGFNFRNIEVPAHPLFNRDQVFISCDTYLKSRRAEDIKHLKHIDEYEEFMSCHGYHYGKWIDNDTFFSIAISMLSGRIGTKSIYLELARHLQTFNVDIEAFTFAFAEGVARQADKSILSKEYKFYL